MMMMKTRGFMATVLVALCCGAAAQPEGRPVPCPAATELTALHLYGLWQAAFSDGATGQAAGSATLLLERHPDWAGSVRGTVRRGDARARLSGDVDEGQFTLDESQDGTRISASWSGTVVPDSCGKEIRGNWSNTVHPETRAFVLRKRAD
jgi:hypothetical protein